MSVQTTVRERLTVREYRRERIPSRVLKKIIEAGLWGPSLFVRGYQPWQFAVVTSKTVKEKLAAILYRKADASGAGFNMVARKVGDMISTAPVVIAVYNTAPMQAAFPEHKDLDRVVEISAIAAAIQNMILVADELCVGSCWLDFPLFCSKEINSLLHERNEMVAMLTLGYSSGDKAPRKKRAPRSEIVRYVR